jgi:cyclopropane fatty-acyl-phospholipid synthase-like methyltransferase
MEIIKNPWEFENEESMRQGLTGESSWETFYEDRRQRVDEIAQFLNIQTYQRGFEIGSGEGTVASLLSKKCLSLDCTDISESFLTAAAVNCIGCGNISFHHIGDEYLDFLEEGAYDFGFALNVFIHLNEYDIYHYLSSVKRNLKPRGRFYFDACTIGEQTMELFRQAADHYRKYPHTMRGLMYFNHPRQLQAIIQEVGLTLSPKSCMDESGWMKVLVSK